MKNILQVRTLIFVLLALILSSCNLHVGGSTQSPAATAGINTANPTISSGAGIPTIAATSASAAANTNPCATSPDGSLKLCFLNLSDGQTLAATRAFPSRSPPKHPG